MKKVIVVSIRQKLGEKRKIGTANKGLVTASELWTVDTMEEAEWWLGAAAAALLWVSYKFPRAPRLAPSSR